MPSSVLITGATGYVGIHVLSNLLRQENIDRILCVTRHKDQDSFWSAIESHVDKFKVAINVPDIKSKIEVVSIDLIQDHNLILPALEKYKQSVSAVHHLACDSTYGHPFEHFKPWVNVTKELIRYCMDSKYPKYFYATGSYGQYLADNPHATSEDYYWINGYFKYKRWMYHYVLAKMEEGLKGTLFQPGYIVAPIDPGQEYIFWRIARMFAALGYAFQYPMGFTPIDMLIDNYMLTLNHPDDSPKVISPCIPQFLYVDKAVQKLIPDLKVVEYENSEI